MLSASIRVVFALAALGACASRAAGQVLPRPPSIDLNAAVASVCRPTFLKDGRPSLSGTGFILHAPAFVPHDVLVSAHHLFGMATAHTTGMAWNDVPHRVTSATCRSFNGDRTWRASSAVAIPGVHAFWALPDVKDVAVLPVVEGPDTTLDLSPTPAVAGDMVWVLAQVQQALPTDGYAHQAHVVSSKGFLAFIYDDPLFRTANTSGAPVVSRDGKVVGVNVGAGRLPNGALLGVADDLVTLQLALSAAR